METAAFLLTYGPPVAALLGGALLVLGVPHHWRAPAVYLSVWCSWAFGTLLFLLAAVSLWSRSRSAFLAVLELAIGGLFSALFRLPLVPVYTGAREWFTTGEDATFWLFSGMSAGLVLWRLVASRMLRAVDPEAAEAVAGQI